MSVQIKFDSRAFQAEFQRRVARSKKSLPAIVNSTAFRIVRSALENTRRADKSDIAKLGITYVTHSKSGKQLKKARATVAPTAQFKLIQMKRFWQRGPNPRSFADAAALDAEIKKKLGRRMQSVGYLAAGWLPAVRKLVRFAGGMFKADVRSFGKAKGSAKPASDGWAPSCTFENWAGLNEPDQTHDSKARVSAELSRALGTAFDAETREMQQFAEKQLNASLQGK